MISFLNKKPLSGYDLLLVNIVQKAGGEKENALSFNSCIEIFFIQEMIFVKTKH